MYQGGGAIREAAALFFYESNSHVWEPKKMTDAERLALFNTKVRPIVEQWTAWSGEPGEEMTLLNKYCEELRTLVMENGDKVTPLLAELERVSGS